MTTRHAATSNHRRCFIAAGTIGRGAAAVAVSLVLACNHLEVRDLGNGHHSLTAVASSGGYAGSHEEAVEEANAFCGHSGQTAVIDRFEDAPALGPLGEHTSSAVFTCAAPAVLDF